MSKKRKPPTPKIWETFLPLAPAASLKDAVAPVCDATWLMAKGIEAESPALLLQLRDEVLPLVKLLGSYVEWYSFLVHNHASGVPTAADDTRAYIHLRIKLRKSHRREIVPSMRLILSAPWKFTRQVELSRAIAGVDARVIDVDRAWEELGKQSAWLLEFIDACDKNADGYQLVRHVRQFLHYFANMTQMRVA